MKDLDDGFTRIANEVLEDLAKCKEINVRGRVILAVIRNTWGWKGNPKERKLSASYLSVATGAGISSVHEAVSELVEKGILLRAKNGRVSAMTGFNKYWPVVRNPGYSGSPDTPEVRISTTPEVQTNYSGGPDTKKEKKEIKEKKVYMPGRGEFKNVLLTEEEFSKLETRFGKEWCEHKIESLSSYMESKGKKYKSHYATLLNWDRMENKKGEDYGKQRDRDRIVAEVFGDE